MKALRTGLWATAALLVVANVFAGAELSEASKLQDYRESRSALVGGWSAERIAKHPGYRAEVRKAAADAMDLVYTCEYPNVFSDYIIGARLNQCDEELGN